MEITVLGSGGCSIIPKPLCQCRICREAREKGIPYARTGPAVFIHDADLLIDTPAEVCWQLNHNGIKKVEHLLFSHLDPDHTEGIRVVEQIALDFRDWRAYKDRQTSILLPKPLDQDIYRLRSSYGSLVEFYRQQGYVKCRLFEHQIHIGKTSITAIPIDRGRQTVFIYVIRKKDRKMVYAPCDIRPFPEDRPEVRDAQLLVIQPGIFENGLKHRFAYTSDHISRKTLYTFYETLALSRRINAKEVLFVHLEEYWNRGFDDYLAIEKAHTGIRFAYDGMKVKI